VPESRALPSARHFPDLYAVIAEIAEEVRAELVASSSAWGADPDSVGDSSVIYPSVLSYATAYAEHGRLLAALSDAAAVDDRVHGIWWSVLRIANSARGHRLAQERVSRRDRRLATADLCPGAYQPAETGSSIHRLVFGVRSRGEGEVQRPPGTRLLSHLAWLTLRLGRPEARRRR